MSAPRWARRLWCRVRGHRWSKYGIDFADGRRSESGVVCLCCGRIVKVDEGGFGSLTGEVGSFWKPTVEPKP